jgi:predicted phage tail protein
MNERSCPQEDRVLGARRAGVEDPALREHVATCDACREALDAFDFMRALAADVPDLDHRLPDAARIWWRAQLVKRWHTERRVAHQLDRVYPIQAAVLAAAVVLAVILSWPVVERWVAQTELGGATLLAASLVPAGMLTSLIGGAVLLALVMVVMARDVLAE